MSPSGFPLSVLCLAVSFGLYVANRILQAHYPVKDDTPVKAILREFQQLVMIITGMLAVASTSFKRKDWCTFFSNILRVGRTLNSSRGVLHQILQRLDNGPLIGFASNSYVRFITWTFLAHFTISVITLEEHLQLFNEFIERLSLPTDAFGKLFFPGKQQNFIQWKVLQDEIQVEWTRTLVALHEDLFVSFRALTATFSIVAVPFVLMVFCDTVTLSFILLVGVANQIIPMGYLVVVVTFVLVAFCNLLVITVCCDNATREFNATPKRVHKAYNNLKDVDIKKQLLQFSKILTTRKASFCAAGLFNIDVSLQYKILAAVASYLVILTQFQMQQVRNA